VYFAPAFFSWSADSLKSIQGHKLYINQFVIVCRSSKRVTHDIYSKHSSKIDRKYDMKLNAVGTPENC